MVIPGIAEVADPVAAGCDELEHAVRVRPEAKSRATVRAWLKGLGIMSLFSDRWMPTVVGTPGARGASTRHPLGNRAAGYNPVGGTIEPDVTTIRIP
jgi:hypothetical protein